MITGVNHLTLSINNVEESFTFYTNVLGFRPVAKWPKGAYLLAGETWVALVLDDRTRQNSLPEYTHLAFTVSPEDFDPLSQRIKGSGAKIWQENRSEGASLYFLDPNGHKLEIHASDLKTRLKTAKASPWEGLEFFEIDDLPKSEAQLQAKMRSILAVTRALINEINTEALLEFIMTHAKDMTNAAGAAVLLLSDNEQYFEVAVPGGLPTQVKRDLQLPVYWHVPLRDESLAGLAIQSQQVQLSNAAWKDDRVASLRPLFGGGEVHSLLCAPLIAQKRPLGVLLLWKERQAIFTSQDSRLIRLFADQVALALSNAHLHAQNRQLAITQERQRLARDLHDTVTQSLYSISMAARTVLRLLDETEAYNKIRRPVEHILTLAKNSLIELREQIYQLSPRDLTEEGLAKTLAKYCDLFRERYGLAIEFTADPTLSFSMDQQVAFYYIAREALWNIIKHTKATRVDISLTAAGDQIRLSISDNGAGFDPSTVVRRETMGLRNMEERARQLGGSLEIHSRLDQGSAIIALIPKIRIEI